MPEAPRAYGAPRLAMATTHQHSTARNGDACDPDLLAVARPRPSIRIEELATAEAEWDAFVHDSPDGTPFHLTAWKRAVEAAFDHRAHYLIARSGARIEGVLPLFEVRGLVGGKGLVSVPYAAYGGICATSSAASTALLEAAAVLGRALQVSYVELRQRHDLGRNLPTKSLYVTFRRPICADEEENAQAIPRKQRRMTRQGAKHGLQVRMGHEHFDAFYDIYAASLRNLGSPVFPRTLLHDILHNFGKSADLLTVWREDVLVSGVISVYYRDEVLPYYGAARHDALPYAVNDFMYWQLMCRAAANGARLFDFGRSRQDTGSYHFKRHWGFEPVPLAYQYLLLRAQAMPDVSPTNPRMDLARRAWQRLPVAVAKAVGPFITRYLP